MDDSEEEDQYQNSEDEWSQGEESYHAFTDEEADYEAPPWPGDDYSVSDFNDEPEFEGNETEPPDFEPYHICYSGHRQGPEAYLRWEKDMEDWFQANQVPEQKKASYAEDTLTEDAFRHWDQDASIRLEYDVPDASWEEMKKIMREEYVEAAEENRQSIIRIYTNLEPRRWLIATRPTPKAKPSRGRCHKQRNWSPNTLTEKTKANLPVQAKDVPQDPIQQVVAPKLSARPLLRPHGKTEQCKSYNSSNNNDIICYRCHKRGHLAGTCPTRQVVTTSKIVLEKEKSKEVKEIVECEIRSFNSCIMHLSLPRDVDAGKWKAKEMIVQRDEPALIMDRTLSLIPHVNEKHEIVLIQQKEKILAGTKEKNATHDLLDSPSHNQGEPRGDFICERRNFAKEDEIMCQSNKHGVIYSMLIKEEPPDAKHQLHPSHHQNRARGNLLNLHLYQDTNLLSLGAGLIVSRSKPFQEGEYDEDIKSSSAKEREILRLEEEGLKLRRPLKFTTQQQNRKSPNQPKKQLSVFSSYENYIWRPGDLKMFFSIQPNIGRPNTLKNDLKVCVSIIYMCVFVLQVEDIVSLE